MAQLKPILLPTALPLSVDLARLQVKQDITADDPLLKIAIVSAAAFAESQTERTLLATRFSLLLDAFPGSGYVGGVEPIELPRSPLIRLVSIEYLDLSNIWQTVPQADYVLVEGDPVVRIAPVFGKIWPIPKPQLGSVKVTFDAGYATPAVVAAPGGPITIGLWSPLAIGDPVRFANTGGALPAPLQPNTDYYVQSVAGSVIRVAATPGGAAIALTDTGSGLHTLGEVPGGIISWMLLRIDSFYVHRGETALVQGKLEAMPYADRLLDPFRAAYL